MIDRYHRQTLLPFIGLVGQEKLAASHVLLVGCGALGGVIAEQLVRAGAGNLTIVDRDVVEWTNLQRQVLFDEEDARKGNPKAIAAGRRLSVINSTVRVKPIITDVHAGNLESLLIDQPNVIIDGTDNVQTRYLLNDAAIKHGIPWIYGACVGAQGRVMVIRPGISPCLRCVFPIPPAVGELPTCDTAGVLGSAAAVVASLQVVAAMKILTGNTDAIDDRLIAMDLWSGRFRSIDTSGLRSDCACCGKRQFEFLDSPVEATLAQLCGRHAVQVRPAAPVKIDLPALAAKLEIVGKVEHSPFLLRCQLMEETGISLTVFADGRAVVNGTIDLARARALVSRYLGS